MQSKKRSWKIKQAEISSLKMNKRDDREKLRINLIKKNNILVDSRWKWNKKEKFKPRRELKSVNTSKGCSKKMRDKNKYKRKKINVRETKMPKLSMSMVACSTSKNKINKMR